MRLPSQKTVLNRLTTLPLMEVTMFKRTMTLAAVLIFALLSVGCCFVPICSTGPEDIPSVELTPPEQPLLMEQPE